MSLVTFRRARGFAFDRIEGDTVLDPFAGSGTTLEVAERLGRNSIGIELNAEYVRGLIVPRLEKVNPLFAVAPMTSTNDA